MNLQAFFDAEFVPPKSLMPHMVVVVDDLLGAYQGVRESLRNVVFITYCVYPHVTLRDVTCPCVTLCNLP